MICLPENWYQKFLRTELLHQCVNTFLLTAVLALSHQKPLQKILYG
jgi:hypothetical protein